MLVCPYCYNNPPVTPIEDAAAGGSKGMPCSECTVPHCAFSLQKLAVCPCDNEACSGTMVLDLISAPKWKMACSVCNSALMLPEGAKKISVSDNICQQCGAMELRVDFNKNDLPAALGGKTTVHKGCCWCDEIIASKCHEGKTRMTHGRRKQFGKKKGGSGGGRGKRPDAKLSFDRF